MRNAFLPTIEFLPPTSPTYILLTQFLFQSFVVTIGFFSLFIPVLFSFPIFFSLSLYSLIGKENRQEINISFVGLMNQCLCSVLLRGLLIYYSLNSLKLPFISLIVLMILFGTVNEIPRKKF